MINIQIIRGSDLVILVHIERKVFLADCTSSASLIVMSTILCRLASRCLVSVLSLVFMLTLMSPLLLVRGAFTFKGRWITCPCASQRLASVTAWALENKCWYIHYKRTILFRISFLCCVCHSPRDHVGKSSETFISYSKELNLKRRKKNNLSLLVLARDHLNTKRFEEIHVRNWFQTGPLTW